MYFTHLLISEKNRLGALYRKRKLKELDVSNSDYDIGQIYIGNLESILPNISAAFVKIDKIKKNGFIQMQNLLPIKVRQKKKLSIESIKLKTNLLVQIVKQPTGTKGPTLTTNLGIVGDYVILLPFGEGITLSKKLYYLKEKEALKSLFTLIKPLAIGILIKKEAYKVSEEKLLKDFYNVQDKWDKICNKLEHSSSPKLLTVKIDFIQRIVKTFYDTTITKFSIDTNFNAWKIYNLLIHYVEKKNNRIILLEYYNRNLSMIENFSLDITLYGILQPRINLITGGYIVIEKTEALTSIDINSGSFNHIINSRASLLWINCEAATEIARQLKLRNLGGIIVVDFIDMNYKKDQMILLDHFNDLLKKDLGNPKIIQLSEIGLIELTRKRQGQNIYDIFASKCPRCIGLGQHFDLSSLITKTKNICYIETGSLFRLKPE